jgi:hypothetical protein
MLIARGSQKNPWQVLAGLFCAGGVSQCCSKFVFLATGSQHGRLAGHVALNLQDVATPR